MNDENPYTDQPRTADSPTEEVYEDDAVFPYARNYWPSGWPTWAPWYEKDVEDEAESEDQLGGDAVRTTEAARTESQWESGLALLLLVIGVGLFVFPEPATSMVGAVLVAAGVLVWLVDRFR